MYATVLPTAGVFSILLSSSCLLPSRWGGLPHQEADRPLTPCRTGCVYTPTPIEMTPLSVSMTKRLGKFRPRHCQSTKLRLVKTISSL
ncbi:hypothetical protein PISMIDRAFT_684553, partial [Pisolithus microcarpus 441]